MKSLPSQYDHAAAQAKWYPEWERRGYFHAEADAKDANGQPKKPFSIVIPPPNVTGALHLGHALNNTLQDILIRMKRMQGYNTLWMPGTDHAGIATQAVVERRLFEEEKKTRHDLGREGLVARIWKWKDQYEKRILSQLKQMGCSCDWARTRFTLDDQCARAVREWFFRLFADGKIYRGKRLVNWDTFLQTAVSDDEVFHEAVKGHFWHIKYPVVPHDRRPGEPDHVVVATTRPETMLGDTAVAVHPDPAVAFDKLSTELREKLLTATAKEKAELEEQMTLLLERRAKVLPQLERLRDMARRGVQLELPLTGRTIPLIADEWAKPELGSGCVKITPAHDANDYDVWQRHAEIGAINILNPDGTLNDAVPEKYRGLNVKKAREAVEADLIAQDYLVDKEDREIDLAHSDRSKTPIEPYLADQWFMRMGESTLPLPTGNTLPHPLGEGRGEGDLPTHAAPSPYPLPEGEGFSGLAEGKGLAGGQAETCSRGLAQMAMDAVTSGRVKIVPERYAKGYLDWLSEKRDWPIGRQLWWGHRIPVWRFQLSRVAQYHQVSGSIVAAVARAYGEFERALTDFAQEFQIGGDIIAAAQPNTTGLVYVCPRTDNAAKELSDFVERQRSTFQIVDPGEPLPQSTYPRSFSPNDSRYTADQNLASLVDSTSIGIDPQETDVLDTWFSSALWPISTLGWPNETPERKAFYPTSVLITSRDIITLWVARMVIAGLYNVGEVPFHEVYITPKILDGYGETMSKSKGNGVDPLDVIEKFGADALRFGLAYLTTDTQDVKLPVDFECPHCQAQFPQTKKNRQLPRIECEKCGEPFATQWAEKPEDKALQRGTVVSERFELGRNFANKLWNAARFSLINLEGGCGMQGAGGGKRSPQSQILNPASLLLEDRWLLSRLTTVTQQVTAALERYRYADAARTLYDFAWNEFCSFYLEMTKARFAVAEQRQTAQRVLAHALDTLLRLLHPMMPFLTEEVWQLMAQVAPNRGLPAAAKAAESVCIAPWPKADTSWQDAKIEEQFADFQAVLGAVREIRNRQNIALKEELTFSVRCDAATAELLRPMQPYFTQMARATGTAWGPEATAPAIVASVSLTGQSGPLEVHVDLSRFIDVGAEQKRLEKERDNLTKQITSIDAKLGNKGFVDKAPAAVVQQQREKLAELRGQLTSIEAALMKLGI